ncbi:hypothetical protein KKC94_05605 [Patescibacteria group bacterium]|nr:hypothetical protein [Patescibacteria group bacterium]
MKTTYISLLLLTLFAFASCTTPPQSSLSEQDAKAIAEKSCIKGGESISDGYYNENSKTWWFDANLNQVTEGCNPACVVSEETLSAEINYRCTGLIIENTNEIVLQLFKEKYPKYQDSLSINITKESADHVRGEVIFEEGVPGGIFFAVKVNSIWTILFDGNGEIPCNLSDYGFDKEMLFDCTIASEKIWYTDDLQEQMMRSPYLDTVEKSPDILVSLINEWVNESWANNPSYNGILPQLAFIKTEGNTIFVRVINANTLTEMMGSAGASQYMKVATYTLTEIESIDFVDYEFEEGSHASPGRYSRETI